MPRSRKTLALGTLWVLVVTTVSVRAQSDAIADIPGGVFRMGTETVEIPRLRQRYGVSFPEVFENETPSRAVTLRDFRLDRHEVTNARFAEFLRLNPDWRKASLEAHLHNGDYLADWVEGRMPVNRHDHPVVFVTWHAAQSFCRWAGGRLPTEAEWEYAARAGDNREFPWGDEEPSPQRANYSASGIGATMPVGSYRPNDFGLHDLAGNVWEFLLDEWKVGYREGSRVHPVAGGPVADEDLLAVEGRRVVRGASYGGSVVNLRTRWRDSHVVTNATAFVGFRCAYPSSAAGD